MNLTPTPTLIPFPHDSVGTGKIYRNPMPDIQHLDYFKSTLKITRVIQLCSNEECEFYGRKQLPDRYRQMDFKVTYFPIPDFKVPHDKKETRRLVDSILSDLKEGNNILIHCVAGNGRTGLILACMARKVFGMKGEPAIKWVRKYIPSAVEREVQKCFVANFLGDGVEEVRKVRGDSLFLPEERAFQDPTYSRKITIPPRSKPSSGYDLEIVIDSQEVISPIPKKKKFSSKGNGCCNIL